MRFSCMVYWWQVECFSRNWKMYIKLMLLVYPYIIESVKGIGYMFIVIYW